MRYASGLLITAIGLFLTVACSSDDPTYYNLTTTAIPVEGGTVTPASGEFEDGEQVEISAQSNEHWLFEGWEGDHTGSNATDIVTMDSDKDIAAVFVKRDYPLTIETVGEGSVTEKVVQPKSTDYPHGTVVELTAEPENGWYFTGWEGDLEGDENPATITVEEESEVTAVFEQIEYPLTVNIIGEGDVDQEVVQTKATDYPHGTIVELNAEPENGWYFTGWEGDLEGDKNPATITIEEETEVTAVFEQTEHSLTVNIVGEGEVEQEVVQAKTTEYVEGTVVELTAMPGEDWLFSFWNEDVTENPITLTVEKDTTITATFMTTATVTTKPVTEITQTSAVSGGEIVDNGGSPVTARGVCYSENQDPTLDDECTDDGSGSGEFSSSITDLTSGITYYVKAYATNEAGISYGEEVHFTTEQGSGDVPGKPTITDVVAGDRELTVHFTPPADDGGQPITHYEYRLNFVSGDPDVDIGLSSPFTIKEGVNDGDGYYEIENGKEYNVRLRAVNAIGPGDRTTFGPVIPGGEEIESDIYVYALAAPDLTREIFINWIDDSPDADGSAQTLRYGTGTPFNQEVSVTGRKIPHANSWVYSARLTDLTPATAYSGSIYKTESRHTDLVRFETLPVSISGADEVKIAFVSDIHIENDEPGSVTVPGNPVNSMNDPARMRFVEEKKLDLFCIVGDIVSNGYSVDETRTEQYLGFFRDHIHTYLNADKLVPLFVVPGNHEVGFPLRQEGGITKPTPEAGYFQLFFNNLYETTGYNFGTALAGNYLQLMGLDVFSSTPDVQKDFFDANVNSSVSGVIPFLHSPLLEGGVRSPEDVQYSDEIRRQLASSFAAQNNIYSYFTGHMHLKFRSKPWTVIETETPPPHSLDLGNNQYLVVDESRNRMVEFGQGYRSNRTPYTTDDKTWYIDDASVAQYNVFFTVTLQDGRHIVTEYNHNGNQIYSKDLREGGE